jgi:hypothetical protein
MTHPAKVREPTLLAEEMAALCVQSKRTGSTFALGALDALRWLTDGGPGPLTGRAAQKPAPVRVVAGELAVAEGRIYGKNSEHARYAQGVLHALMWAQYATAAPPTQSASTARPDTTRAASRSESAST